MTREIVIDTETTGFDPQRGHRLVEIGCVELERLIPTGRRFHAYVDPGRDMPAEAERIHGLSARFLAGKPRFKDVADAFLDFVADAPLVAHNAGFDRAFINSELAGCGRAELPEPRWIDTIAIAKQKFPGATTSLDALCRRFGVPLDERQKHGALVDARLLAAVYLELRGGREQTLAFTTADAARAVHAATQNGYGARPRPLPPRSTDEERARHAAFVRDELQSDRLWRRFGLR